MLSDGSSNEAYLDTSTLDLTEGRNLEKAEQIMYVVCKVHPKSEVHVSVTRMQYLSLLHVQSV